MSSDESSPGIETSAKDPLIGLTLGGRFELTELVARGSSGTIYKGLHKVLNSTVAVKVLASTDAEKIRRFQREAKVLSSLQHPNIVSVSSFGQDEGRFFLVMDWLPGKTLFEILQNQTLSLEESVTLAMQICSGLSYVHKAGILHRDLNAANIMIVSEAGQADCAKILDFGLSKFYDSNQASDDVTPRGEIAGSPAYMSPEQCRAEELDQRSDIYSFGCLFYEMLAGHTPFEATSPLDMMSKQVNEAAPALTVSSSGSKVPQQLAAIVDRCLAKDRNSRYKNFDELYDALAALSTTVLRLKLPVQAKRSSSQLKIAVFLCALSVVLVFSAKIITSLPSRNTIPSKPVETSNFAQELTEVLTQHWPSLRSMIKRKLRQNQAGEAEQLLSLWLTKHSLDELTDDSISQLIRLCSELSEAEDDSQATFRILVPNLSRLQKQCGVDNYEIKFSLLKYLLISVCHPAAQSKDVEFVLGKLKLLCEDPQYPSQAELINFVFETGGRFVQKSSFAAAARCFDFGESELKSLQPKGSIQTEEAIGISAVLKNAERICTYVGLFDDALKLCKLNIWLVELHLNDARFKPMYAASLYRLSRLYSELGQSDKATQTFDAAQKQDFGTGWTLEQKFYTYSARLLALQQLNRFAEAELCFRKAFALIEHESLQSDSDMFNQVDDLVNQLILNKQPAMAEFCIPKLIESRKRTGKPLLIVPVQQIYAQALIDQGKYDQAMEVMVKAREEIMSLKAGQSGLPSETTSPAFKARTMAEIMLRMANIELERGAYKEACKFADQCVLEDRKGCGKLGSSNQELADFVHSDGAIHLAAGNLNEAEKLFVELAKMRANASGLYFLQGIDDLVIVANLRMALGKKAAAIADLDKAWSLLIAKADPAMSSRLCNTSLRISDSYLQCGLQEQSFTAFEQALSFLERPESMNEVIKSCFECGVYSQRLLNAYPASSGKIKALMQSALDTAAKTYGKKSPAVCLLSSYKASLIRVSNQPAVALGQHRAILERFQQVPDMGECLMHVEFEMGQDCLALKEFGKAKSYFAKCIDSKTERAVEALCQLTNLNIASGDYAEAKRYNNEVLTKIAKLHLHDPDLQLLAYEQCLNIYEHDKNETMVSQLKKQIELVKSRRIIEANM